MPSRSKSKVTLPSIANREILGTPTSSNVPTLGLDGYNFAINRMHMICGKYAMRSENYLRNARVPDLDEYLAWKAVSRVAMLRKYSVQQAVDAYQVEYCDLSQRGARDCASSTLTASATSVEPHFDSPEMDAARILTALNFHALTSSGVLHPYDFPPPFIEAPSDELFSPLFPRPDNLPMPDGADAFLLNPTLEDAQRRWVKGHQKKDQTRDIFVKDAHGNRIKVKKTVYIVDGDEFHDLVPQRKRGTGEGRKRRPPKLVTASPGLIERSARSIPNYEPRSKKRPLDSGIALDADFESPSYKRIRSDSSNDVPLSSMSRPGLDLRRRSSASVASRKVSSGSNSSGSQLSTKDVDNLRAVLGSNAISSVMGAMKSSGQPILPAPATKPTTTRPQHPSIAAQSSGGVATSGAGRSTCRRAPPAPLNLAPPTRSTRTRVTPSPSPMTPAVTPQRSSATGTTPRKNKYVPTTPNPQRWTATELYHLNGLARQGLHPKELHPKMIERFPDKLRSVHAIKDRRDKMARGKELQGKVPDYQARYGNV